MGSVGVDVSFSDESWLAKVSHKAVVDATLDVFNLLRVEEGIEIAGRLEVAFVTEPEMLEVNSEYRGKSYVTDVISFSYLDSMSGPEEQRVLGELIISLEQAKRQAPEFGNDFPSEILRLLIHGVLHVLGYEHEDVSEERVKEMQSLEDKLFSKLNPAAHELLR